MLTFVLAVASALVFSFLCSVSEAVLLSVQHAQIQAVRNSRAAELLRRFKHEIDVPIAAILVLNTVANTAGSAIAGASYNEIFGDHNLWTFPLIFTAAVLVFGEIVPKTIGVTFVPKLAPAVAFFVHGLSIGLKPILFLTRGLTRLLRRGRKQPVTSVEEIRLLVALGRTEGVVVPAVAKIVEGATSLRELTAYDIMVPRAGIVSISGTRPLPETLEQIRESGHSRFPFSPGGDLDNITGVVLVKELMFQLIETPGTPYWGQHLGPLVFVPSGMKLDRLLREFQEKRRHLAVVVDEYGGTEGIVTLEDVLEEIVGEIEDETDRVDPYIVRREDTLTCRGWAETRKVFELLGLDETVDPVTVGGFAAQQLGRLPRIGDTFMFHGFTFKVTLANQRRAERIEVGPVPRSRRSAIASSGDLRDAMASGGGRGAVKLVGVSPDSGRTTKSTAQAVGAKKPGETPSKDSDSKGSTS